MIEWIEHGNIFDSGCIALVNPVNCVGVMGKGLALQFKEKFPHNFEKYETACRNGEIKVGQVTCNFEKGHFIINFPTKKHWRNPSELDWIDKGLMDLRLQLYSHHTPSVAIPALGCGLGGLQWKDVRDLIENRLGDLDMIIPNMKVRVYCP